MTVPPYLLFIEPVLRVLAANPSGVLARDVHEAAATARGLTETDRQELLPSGAQPVFKNRAGWAHDRLKRAGLSQSPRRGHWKVTDEGLRFVKTAPPKLSNERG
jgi:restriction system protein